MNGKLGGKVLSRCRNASFITPKYEALGAVRCCFYRQKLMFVFLLNAKISKGLSGKVIKKQVLKEALVLKAITFFVAACNKKPVFSNY
ncbi:hypothetical protein [Mucilaginibacter arboris]|uniref:Uncharacterized protein n=1 Tax=Mucilaginibacter arboris TaxID=2682090 RepID=A0A7K1SVY8_9SPHI|nr:hypothetical protein [Mucilaginibacter arboris]MVN21407.1 hypothetical protein [Mucilaginibacter arboris]